MTTFALIHGAWHGGWCFERLAAELEARGHAVVAPDLPCEDIEAGAEDYARVVVGALGEADDIVVAAHSLGGLTAPLVAVRRPVRHLVLLCAFVPEPGLSLLDQIERDAPFASAYGSAMRSDDEGRTAWADDARFAELVCGDASVQDARAAFARLRPQARPPIRETTPLKAWPDVPTTSVVAREDRMIRPDWSRAVARERFRVDPIEIDGDHSPALSRAGELAAILQSV
jgi:pimeloyl-ACP methyl ester carboxylesterase